MSDFRSEIPYNATEQPMENYWGGERRFTAQELVTAIEFVRGDVGASAWLDESSRFLAIEIIAALKEVQCEPA